MRGGIRNEFRGMPCNEERLWPVSIVMVVWIVLMKRE